MWAFRWWRKLRGGHWEYVFVEFCAPSHFWLRQAHDDERRPVIERLLMCEDYG